MAPGLNWRGRAAWNHYRQECESRGIALELEQIGVSYRPYERRLKSRRNQVETYAGFEFNHGSNAIQATVFPVDGIRQAPMSPIDGRPMKRADAGSVQALLEHN